MLPKHISTFLRSLLFLYFHVRPKTHVAGILTISFLKQNIQFPNPTAVNYPHMEFRVLTFSIFKRPNTRPTQITEAIEIPRVEGPSLKYKNPGSLVLKKIVR